MKLLNSLEFLPQHPSRLGAEDYVPFERETMSRARLEAAPSDPTTLHEPLDLLETTHCWSCCSHQSLPKRCWTPPAHQRWPNLMENQNNNLKIPLPMHF